MSTDTESRYIHAGRWRIFTRLYDPVLGLAIQERRFRGAMLARVDADLTCPGPSTRAQGTAVRRSRSRVPTSG
jgi:hypothetical protein